MTFSCEWDPTPWSPTGQEGGIDVGLATFTTRSGGAAIATPRFFRREEQALARAQSTHKGALDAHKATREVVTQRVKQAHPAVDEASVWQAVSQEAEERVAWSHGRMVA